MKPPHEELPSDEELLYVEDEAELWDYDRRRTERALEKYGDAFRFQLVTARQLERWADRLRASSPSDLEKKYVQGYVQALREVAAHLRQCSYLPGGVFFDVTPGTTEPFYTPPPALFAHPNAYRLYTSYAAKLKDAGLAERFPVDAEYRHVVIELLAERYAIDAVLKEPNVIANAVAEARSILEKRRRS